MDIEEMVERPRSSRRRHGAHPPEAVAMFPQDQSQDGARRYQLADGSSGIDAVNEILTGTPVPVIFITASRSVCSPASGRNPHSRDQAVQPDMCEGVISQALFFDRQGQGSRLRPGAARSPQR